jgi:hypothetical protein
MSYDVLDRTHTAQAQVQQCEDKDAKARNELMNKLNDMSTGVEQVIHTREQVRSQSATIETDELYAISVVSRHDPNGAFKVWGKV